jgi:hypothetical protein
LLQATKILQSKVIAFADGADTADMSSWEDIVSWGSRIRFTSESYQIKFPGALSIVERAMTCTWKPLNNYEDTLLNTFKKVVTSLTITFHTIILRSLMFLCCRLKKQTSQQWEARLTSPLWWLLI